MNLNPLVSELIQSDPRVEKAKKLLVETIEEHRQKIIRVRPANPERKLSYEQLLAQFAEYRGAKLWFPFLGSGAGNGSLVELLDGSVKYDFITGIGPHFFGHSNPKLIEASIDAAISDTIMQGHLQQNADSIELSALLTNSSKLPHCFLTTAGAMANENAIKLAFQKKAPAQRILAFERCFVGRTYTMSQITDKPAFREGLPVHLNVDYIPYFDAKNPEESTTIAVATLKKFISRYPKLHACMIFELIQGEGGFYPGNREFFVALMDILKENQIAIFVDEVQTFGRTSELFAYQHFGLQKYVDICTIGKMSLVCATLFTEEYRPKPGLLSQTFTASTSAIRSARVVIDSLLNDGFFGPEGKIMKINHHFVNKFQSIERRHPNLIQGPYGLGGMIAFTPFDGDAARVSKFVHDLFEAGVLSFVAGANPTRVRFLPPAGVLTNEDIDRAMEIVEATLKK